MENYTEGNHLGPESLEYLLRRLFELMTSSADFEKFQLSLAEQLAAVTPTESQLAAMNSGITAEDVEKIRQFLANK